MTAPKVTQRADRSPGTQICSNLRAQIMDGLYAPGAALPSSRALAAELGVSRTTVTAAYDQLIAEGYLEIQTRIEDPRCGVVPVASPDARQIGHRPRACPKTL